MAKRLDPVVRGTVAYVAAWVIAGGMLAQGVCLVLGWWDLTVLLGSVLRSATAVGNFLLMCLMIQSWKMYICPLRLMYWITMLSQDVKR